MAIHFEYFEFYPFRDNFSSNFVDSKCFQFSSKIICFLNFFSLKFVLFLNPICFSMDFYILIFLVNFSSFSNNATFLFKCYCIISLFYCRRVAYICIKKKKHFNHFYFNPYILYSLVFQNKIFNHKIQNNLKVRLSTLFYFWKKKTRK